MRALASSFVCLILACPLATAFVVQLPSNSDHYCTGRVVQACLEGDMTIPVKTEIFLVDLNDVFTEPLDQTYTESKCVLVDMGYGDPAIPAYRMRFTNGGFLAESQAFVLVDPASVQACP